MANHGRRQATARRTGRLAWQMQTDRITAGQGQDGNFGVLTVVQRETAAAALGSGTLLKTAQDTTLVEGGQDIRFRHQLLQEYFTAQALLKRLGETHAASLWPSDRWWSGPDGKRQRFFWPGFSRMTARV